MLSIKNINWKRYILINKTEACNYKYIKINYMELIEQLYEHFYKYVCMHLYILFQHHIYFQENCHRLKQFLKKYPVRLIKI